jgi:hypothetical protein
MDVTVHAVCAHLGIGNQPQWTGRVIARATPALLALLSAALLVTRLAHAPLVSCRLPLPQTAQYSEALGRRCLWTHATFPTSPGAADAKNVSRALLDHQ